MSPLRVALYGHDTVGLGHLRRNMALAAAIAETPERPDVLVVTGALEAGAYRLPAGVDVVTVPGVSKDAGGRYGSRRLRSGLDAVLAVRRAAITSALESFDPDLLVVDKVPYGFGGELRPFLSNLRHRRSGDRTQVVLGLRDVLDEPVVARSEWSALHVNDALRHHVDEVWVYGDRTVHDLGEACAVPPALRRRFHYTGYLSTGRVARPTRPPGVGPRDRYVLCTAGGGQDGVDLAAAFAAATLPGGHRGVLVTGSQMPDSQRRAVRRIAAGRGVTVVDFSPDVAAWMATSSAIVAMGGYNTVAEILATGTPALIVPRTRPRVEQAVRAAALGAAGHIDCVSGHGAENADPAVIARWVADAVRRPPVDRRHIDLDGVAAAGHRASSLLHRGRLHAAAG